VITQKGFKYRLYPTNEQIQLLKQQAGNTRFLWNKFLAENIELHKQTGKFKFSHEMIVSLPNLKKEFDFLNQSFSQSLQMVGRQLDKAMKDCFKKSKGFPKFKKKGKQRDSFTVPQKWRLAKGFVFIPKIGEVKWVKHRPLQGKPKHITITQDGEQWYCSVTCEIEIKEKPIKSEKMIGIDVGLKTFAVFSDGTKIENPKFLRKKEEKLARQQRRLSRKVKGSQNYIKQRMKVQRIHRDIRNARLCFLHKTTHDMITKYDGFVFEDLNIKGMMQNHKLAKSVSDVAWYEFKRQTKYKSSWNFKVFQEIDRFEPTSKTCCKCGWYNKDLTLKDRVFECQGCSSKMDRDENASINILNTAARAGINVCGVRTNGFDNETEKRKSA